MLDKEEILKTLVENIKFDRSYVYALLVKFLESGDPDYKRNIPKLLEVVVKNNEQLLKVLLDRGHTENIQEELDDTKSEVDKLYDELQREASIPKESKK